jgi:hypothetical protein
LFKEPLCHFNSVTKKRDREKEREREREIDNI